MMIREWSKRFRSDPLASKVVAQLRERSNEIWRETFDLLQRESRLIPAWAHNFIGANDSPSRELTRTIRAFADCNFNVKQTARRLNVHTNTVYFRLNRISALPVSIRGHTRGHRVCSRHCACWKFIAPPLEPR
jgi:hypothetical protein